MDNGLIFPYPSRRAHPEPGDAHRPESVTPSGESWRRRGNRSGSREAMG